MRNILIIEDDVDINTILSKILIENGYKTTCAYSGSEGKLIIEQKEFDLILLDLMIPGIEGEDLIKIIREKYTVPIIIISAKPGIETKIKSLQLGADDFIVKPFDNREIIARVEAQLRRNNIFAVQKQQTENEIIRYKNCSIDTKCMIVKIKENIINLTALEYQLLLTFLQNKGQVFTRENLFKMCWKQEFLGTDNTVDVHISRIRNKIAEFDDEEYIQTIRGIGFRLNP